MTAKVLTIIYGDGSTGVHKSADVSEWVLDEDEWAGSTLEEKRLMIDDLEECRELWPQWLVEDVKDLEEQWNAEVMGGV